MDLLLQWFRSPEWQPVVKTLLHTLWQGAVAAGLLALALRRENNPVARYRYSFTAMIAVLAAGVVTWAVISRPEVKPVATTGLLPAASVSTVSAVTSPAITQPSTIAAAPSSDAPSTANHWTAWLAFVWFSGAAVMLMRGAIQVAGAERLRRSTRPLEDARISAIIAEAKAGLRLSRKIRVSVTDRLTSPAVVGVLVPTLVLPLSLLTVLTPEQLRFVLLHELAHIRRGDYFANLFQLFTESLLFFNPAVWWISHQIRREREACCDALATELSGAPVDYARTLLHVAENLLSPMPAAALSFGEKRGSSSLVDRVQRLLVPGYRPSVRLTWRTILMALFVGGTLLILSAMGTRVAVAAILSPQQRIERIEKKMAEYGQKPGAKRRGAKVEQVAVTAHFRTADGAPLPKKRNAVVHSIRPGSSGYYGMWIKDNGIGSYSVSAGEIWVEGEANGYAPALAGPFDCAETNKLDVDVVFTRGFEVPVQVTDAVSGAPITNGLVHAGFVIRDIGDNLQGSFDQKLDSAGQTVLSNCIDQALTVVVKAPGYELVEQRFEHLNPKQAVEVKMKRGAVASGLVVDKTTGKSIAGAEIRVVAEGRDQLHRYGWEDPVQVLAKTDAQGHFTINQLRTGLRYWLGINAVGHESLVTNSIQPGTTDAVIKLGPELIIRGRVLGDLKSLRQVDNDHVLDCSYSEVIENSSYGNGEFVRIHVTNGVATFQFKMPYAAMVTLSGDSYREERDVRAPIDDWLVDLSATKTVTAESLPKREVIFRFLHSADVQPHGTVAVEFPDNLDPNNLTAHYEDMEITNSEVHAQIPIGGHTALEPKHLIGCWFNPAGTNGNLLSIEVRNDVGPLVIDVPVIPAGAIYAKARNVDGAAAGKLFFGINELKRAPGREESSLDNGADSISNDAPRKWVSGPLPLGGTYQVYGWRENSFCVSKPIKLTEANPDAEVELQFQPGQTFDGLLQDPDGAPIPNVDIKVSFALPNGHGFELHSVSTDNQGRFQINNTTPDAGTYSVQPVAPGMLAENVKLKFSSQPQVIKLKRGRTLAGHVLQSGTGYPIPNAEIRALDYEKNKLPMLTTRTDADGRFEFNRLGDVEYTLYVEGGEMVGDRKFRADGSTKLVIPVKLYGWSKLKPKALEKNPGRTSSTSP